MDKPLLALALLIFALWLAANTNPDHYGVKYVRTGLEWIGLGSIVSDLSANKTSPLDARSPYPLSIISGVVTNWSAVFSAQAELGPFTFASLASATPQTAFGDGLEIDVTEPCPNGTARHPYNQQLCSLVPRADIVLDYVSRGGILRRWETTAKLGARLGYFKRNVPVDLARKIFGESINFKALESRAMMMLNTSEFLSYNVDIDVLRAGVEIPVRTRTPQFLVKAGENLPDWLKVVMHHSQLFEAHRVPTVQAHWYLTENVLSATTIVCNETHFGSGSRNEPTVNHRWNMAMMMDADSVFQATTCYIPETKEKLETFPLGSTIAYLADSKEWQISHNGKKIGSTKNVILRFTVTFAGKAADEPNTLLTLDSVLKTLEKDLRARQRLNFREHLLRADFPKLRYKYALFLMSEYINFPSAGPNDFNICSHTGDAGATFEPFLNGFFECEGI